MFTFFKSKKKEKDIFTVAFYNLENLFDTVDDPKTIDDDFTQKGLFKWSKKRYYKKIKKLTSVMTQLGTEISSYPPIIIGVAEIENKTVMNDLIYSKTLKEYHYDYVQYDSPDKRGIDVGFLYNKQLFELLSSKVYPLLLENQEGKRDFTRDVLLVTGNFNGELMHILINHWPSRRDGVQESEYKRLKASELNQKIVSEIRANNKDAKIIIMGDFNDNPTNKSVQHLVAEGLYNPMQSLLDKGKGSLKHEKDWFLFDQILFSTNFRKPTINKHTFKYAEVFDKDFLKIHKGKNKGKPFRTYIWKWYQGGFSDHFPVYVYLKKNEV